MAEINRDEADFGATTGKLKRNGAIFQFKCYLCSHFHITDFLHIISCNGPCSKFYYTFS